MQPEESITQVPSSVLCRSRRDAAERANDRRRTHNVSIDGLNQAIVGQSILLEMLSAERVERKDVVVLLACRGRARPKIGPNIQAVRSLSKGSISLYRCGRSGDIVVIADGVAKQLATPSQLAHRRVGQGVGQGLGLGGLELVDGAMEALLPRDGRTSPQRVRSLPPTPGDEQGGRVSSTDTTGGSGSRLYRGARYSPRI